MAEQEYLFINRVCHLDTRLTLSRLEEEFAKALMECKILGARCKGCHRILIPPRVVCNKCEDEVEETLLDQGSTGIVQSAIKLEYKITDCSTAKPKPTPYPYATIELEGGGRVDGFLNVDDLSKVKVGQKVRPLWKPKEERIGHLTDIVYWEII